VHLGADQNSQFLYRKRERERERESVCVCVLHVCIRWYNQNRMAEFAGKWWWGLRSVWMVLLNFLLAFVFVSAERDLRVGPSTFNGTQSTYFLRAVNFLWQPDKSSYQHVWPVMFLIHMFT
jgi:hypothetical protein